MRFLCAIGIERWDAALKTGILLERPGAGFRGARHRINPCACFSRFEDHNATDESSAARKELESGAHSECEFSRPENKRNFLLRILMGFKWRDQRIPIGSQNIEYMSSWVRSCSRGSRPLRLRSTDSAPGSANVIQTQSSPY